ncbi:hypothetical protein [Natronorubrum sp. DTA7]|uniref:hypothetical protein n=1 Tax=Natronorubrum sp. DTA7 TaxID=3447016 RepID=UPI003F85591C
MEAFLRERYNPGNGQDKNPVRIEDLVGMKIAGTGIPEHIRLKAPLNSSKCKIQDYVEFRLLENGVRPVVQRVYSLEGLQAL